MTDWIRVVIAIVTWPLRASWKLYALSWWAFEDDRRGEAGPETLPRRRPDRALKHGFAATLATGMVAAWAGAQASHLGWVEPGQATGGAMWVLGAAWVLSLFAVRRREKREGFANAKTAPLGLPAGAENTGVRAKFLQAARGYAELARSGCAKAGVAALGAGKLGRSALFHAARAARAMKKDAAPSA